MNRATASIACLLLTCGSLLSLSTAAPAKLGPPMICQPVEIGDSKSLTPKSGPINRKAAQAILGDTIKLLEAEPSALVRMETIRRACMAVQEHRDAGIELLGRLSWIALDARQSGDASREAAALFNAGYLAGCMNQLGCDIDFNPGTKDSIIGYAWISRALELSNRDPEMEFGAAVLTLPEMVGAGRSDLDAFTKRYEAHLGLALKNAKPDSLLDKNVKSHCKVWGRSLKER